MILRGNHKSAKENISSTALEKSMGTEVEHGWSLPLTIYSFCHIINAGAIPIGVSERFSVNEKGERYTKIHVIRGCSFPEPSCLSGNNRILKETLQPCFYRLYLLRILHTIAAIRIKWPSNASLSGKHILTPHPREHTEHIKMNFHHGKNSPPMPPPTFRHNTRTVRVHHSKRIWNWPGKWFPQGQVMVCHWNPVTPQTPTQGRENWQLKTNINNKQWMDLLMRSSPPPFMTQAGWIASKTQHY